MEQLKPLDSVTENTQVSAILKDLFKYAPSKFCGMIGNALIVPVYTSILSTEQYGIYSLSIALLSFLCIIFSDWIGLSGLRFFRQNQLMENMPKYITTLVVMLVCNIFLMFGLTLFFHNNLCEFFHIPLKYLIAIIFLIIPVALRALLFQLLRAQLKSIAFTFSTILNQILTIGLSVIFVKVCNLGAIAMLLGMAVSISLIDVVLLFQSNVLKYLKPQKIEWKFIFPIVKYGIPIAATSLAAWIINQSNKFIMNSINGFSDVGIVGVAYGLTLPLLMTIFSTITVAVIPRIYNLYEEKFDVTPIISKFIGYYMLIALPLVLTMVIFSVDYVHLFSSNPNFYIAYKVIPYFALGTFFLSLTDYTTLQYHLANKTIIDFVLKFTSGTLGIILNIILIPKLSLVGVGIATLSANLTYFILSLIIVLPNHRLKYPKELMDYVLVALVPYLYVSVVLYNFVHIHSIIKFIILFVTYYLSYWALRKYVKN